MAAKDEVARQAWRRLTALFVGGENATRVPRIAAELGLTPGQMHALLRLRDGEPVPMRAVASHLACDASYATNLVDSLEAPGYVERQVAEHDRRVKLVHLTRRGREVQVEALDRLSQPPESFDRLTTAELKTLESLLSKVVDGPLPFWSD